MKLLIFYAGSCVGALLGFMVAALLQMAGKEDQRDEKGGRNK